MTYCCICGDPTTDGADVHDGLCAEALAERETADAEDARAIRAAEMARDRAEARLAYLELPAWRRALVRWRTRRSEARSAHRLTDTEPEGAN